MSALALAQRIVTVPDVLVHYRVGMANNLQSRNSDTPLLFAQALRALKDKLSEEGVYGKVRDSFVNLALNVTVYNLKILAVDVRKRAFAEFRKEYLSELELDGGSRTQFSIPANYDYLCLLKLDDLPCVSVVVPVFNVEKYLKECLDSLLDQTFWNLEVICIDDGSKDRSLSILEEYRDRFATRGIEYVICARENNGLGASRNFGLGKAQGKYVYFLDSDDWILPNTLLELCALAERESLDQILFSAKAFCDDAEKDQDAVAKYDRYYTIPTEICNARMSGCDFIKKYLEIRSLVVSSPLKFFRREFLMKSGIRYPEHVLHEDEAFAYVSIGLSASVMAVNARYYQRRVRSGSIMTSADNHIRRAIGYLRNIEVLVDIATKCGNTELSDILFKRSLQLVPACLRELGENRMGADMPSDTFMILMKKVQEENGRNLREIKALKERVNKFEVERAGLKRELDGLKYDRQTLNENIKSNECNELRRKMAKLERKNCLLAKEVNELKKAESYRLGMALTWPLRKFYRLWR